MEISERQFTVEELSMFENAKQNSKLLVFGASLSPFFLAILLQLFVLKYSNILFFEFSKTTIFSFVAFNAWCFGYWYYKKKLNQVHDFKLENQHLKVYDFTITKCYYKPVFQSSDFNFVLKTIDNNFVFLTTDAIDCETLKNQFKVQILIFERCSFVGLQLLLELCCIFLILQFYHLKNMLDQKYKEDYYWD